MITFCLMTCGEDTEAQCLESIAPFKNEIVLQEVRNVYPQIKALNQMLNQVQTEYLVPLDADIILNENAYERIKTALKLAESEEDFPNWHSILFSLFDTFTEEKIFALKVLNMSIIKNFPFAESATPDIEHYSRLYESGYRAINYFGLDPIGTHNVVGPKYCYNKYKDVYKTLRVYGKEWATGVFKGGETILEKSKCHFNYFEYKWAMTGNKDYLYAIAGMVDGLTVELDNSSKSLENDLDINVDLAIENYINWYFNQQQSNIFL